jgi:hypothetical protein
MEGTGDHHGEQDKPSSKGQLLHVVSHSCVKPRPKMMMIIIIMMGHEWGGG